MCIVNLRYFQFLVSSIGLCPTGIFSYRVSGDLSKLPEGSPGYSHEKPQAPDSSLPPQPHLGSPRPQPEVRHKFYSQSIVTIRKADGVSIKTCSLVLHSPDLCLYFRDYSQSFRSC